MLAAETMIRTGNMSSKEFVITKRVVQERILGFSLSIVGSGGGTRSTRYKG